MSTFCEKWEVSYMTKEEFIKHLLKAKVVLEKLAKKQDVYDEIEERMYEEYRKEENIRNETKRKWTLSLAHSLRSTLTIRRL